MRAIRALAVIAGPLLLTTAAILSTAPPADGATSCRVRNVHQGSYGRSLVRMVEKARDGDHIRVRGTCPGEVVIRADITVVGSGPRRAELDGRQRGRVVNIRHGARVTLRRVVLTGGDHCLSGGLLNLGAATLIDVAVRGNIAGGDGGIFNDGRLTLIRSVVRGNTAEADHPRPGAGPEGPFCSGPGGGITNWSRLRLIDSVVAWNRSLSDDSDFSGGGGIWNQGSLRIIRSVVRNNSAPQGGGILNDGYRLVLIDSLVTGNDAMIDGGGIWASGRSITVLRDGTSVSANTAGRRGGGIKNGKRAGLALYGSTVADNQAGTEGGGIWNSQGSPDDGVPPGIVTLDAGSSVAGNVPDDCVGTAAC